MLNAIHQVERLTDDEKHLITSNVQTKKYKKGEYLLHSGKVANHVYFIVSGIIRFFFFDINGKEITTVFFKENDFVTSLISFKEFSPSSGTLQTETDCELIVIERKAWDLLQAQAPNWKKAVKKITDDFLMNKVRFQQFLIHHEAKDTYLFLLKKEPNIVQRVPIGHLASYLGITIYSLSRIRKQIVNADFLP